MSGKEDNRCLEDEKGSMMVLTWDHFFLMHSCFTSAVVVVGEEYCFWGSKSTQITPSRTRLWLVHGSCFGFLEVCRQF